MGWLSRVFGNEEREYHDDGSYTDRDESAGRSATYNKDGSLREYSVEKNPFIGPSHVDTYDSDGKLINSQIINND